MQAVVVEADQLPQEVDRQQIAALAVLLEDDLRQYRAGDVLAGLRIEDHELLAVADHLAEFVEGDVAAGRRVVEAAIGIFLDHRDLLGDLVGALELSVRHRHLRAAPTGGAGLWPFTSSCHSSA